MPDYYDSGHGGHHSNYMDWMPYTNPVLDFEISA